MQASAKQVILHLGIGSFHRAHQAWYLHRLAEMGDESWTIAAGNIRDDNPEVLAALRAQGGAYTLETVAPDGERAYTLIRSIRRVVPFERDHASLIAIAADPATRIISFTVTESGYEPEPGNPLYNALALALQARMNRRAGPVTLLSCDNLRHNGERSRAGLMQFLENTGDRALAAWIRDNTSSPNAMVDRITPRPPSDLQARVREATGREDGAPVMAESFSQWVIEDTFLGGRPAWERTGVEMVTSVQPYEEAKIRLLNATHSVIAWAGSLRGHRFIHESAADARVQAFAREYTTEAIACLRPSPVNLEAYRDRVLDRFRNAALADTVQRVTADSYAKLQGFVAPTVRDRLRRGERVDGVALLPALYLAFLGKRDAASIDALCADTTLWGDRADDATFSAAVRGAMHRVSEFAR